MRYLWLTAALLVVACTAPENARHSSAAERQQPSVTEPGLHLSGYARIGVTRRY